MLLQRSEVFSSRSFPKQMGKQAMNTYIFSKYKIIIKYWHITSLISYVQNLWNKLNAAESVLDVLAANIFLGPFVNINASSAMVPIETDWYRVSREFDWGIIETNPALQISFERTQISEPVFHCFSVHVPWNKFQRCNFVVAEKEQLRLEGDQVEIITWRLLQYH